MTAGLIASLKLWVSGRDRNLFLFQEFLYIRVRKMTFKGFFFQIPKFRNTLFLCLDLWVCWACTEAQGSNWMQNICSICHHPPRPQSSSQKPIVWGCGETPNVTTATCQEKEVEIKGVTALPRTRVHPPSRKVFQIKAAVSPNTLAIGQEEAMGLNPKLWGRFDQSTLNRL